MSWTEIAMGVAAGLGLAAACGMRVFVPLLVAGLSIRFGAVASQPELAWISSWPALLGFGTATVLEIGAYYFPWVDNALDTIATPASMVAGILVSAALFVGFDPFVQWAAAIVAGGGAAGTVQVATVATRAASTGTTAGLANPLFATVENIGSVVLAVLAVLLPAIAGILLLGVFGLAVWKITSRYRER